MQSRDRIFVAGHRGLVGSAVVRALRTKGFEKTCCCARGRNWI
ncbi:NAD-dependent epimerase/dehydratase family protein [Metallibacterium sp.]|nr:NAD-dependent epimerase/dehydratase family protein [Metallibacterium sp.]